MKHTWQHTILSVEFFTHKANIIVDGSGIVLNDIIRILDVLYK